jgi:hypothetical protein
MCMMLLQDCSCGVMKNTCMCMMLLQDYAIEFIERNK